MADLDAQDKVLYEALTGIQGKPPTLAQAQAQARPQAQPDYPPAGPLRTMVQGSWRVVCGAQGRSVLVPVYAPV